MVIERVFSRHATDSIFKFLAFLQHLHPLFRHRDRGRLDGMTDVLTSAERRLAPPVSYHPFVVFFLLFGHVCGVV